MAVSKSFDIPIDKLHERQIRFLASAVAQLAQPRERASRRLGGGPSAAMVIKPTTGMARQAAIDSASLRICSGVQPCLLGSSEVLTCRQTPGGSSTVRARVVEGSQQLERVDRMNHPAPWGAFS